MRQLGWISALVVLLAAGVIAAGCGGDDESSDTAATTAPTATTEDDTTAEETTGEATTDETTEDSTTAESGSTPDDVFNACMDAIAGTPAESAGQSACEQARTAFEQCTKQAEATGNSDAQELAVKACQTAADQTVAALQAGG
jgi:hypothetical protein